MGARLPAVERPRRGGIKCEFCGRAVPSISALRSHQNSLHSSALKRKDLLLKKKKIKPSKVQKPVPRVAPKLLPKINPVKKAPTEKSADTKESTITVDKTPKTENGKAVAVKVKPRAWKESLQKAKMADGRKRKIEFQCPKCSKVFPVLFSAQRHIQKRHPSSDNDSSNTKTLQPITLELCCYCNDKFPSPHECPNRPSSNLNMMYKCVGCEQQFSCNKLFDVHVTDIHGDLSETLFFPSEEEFTNWKEKMEAQTDCKYTVMGQYNSRQVHRCCNVTDNSTDEVVRFCPSTIISKDVCKGIQVNFYIDHHGHKHQEYEMTAEFKSYTVTDLIQQATSKIPDLSPDDSDLYLHFKFLMESIVLDAAKLNIATLKDLIAKAVDMTSVLAQYDEDQESMFENTNVLTINVNKRDDTITSVMEGLRSSKRNKKSNEENGTAKKLKVADAVAKTPKVNSSFSLADEKDSDKILKELDRDNVKSKGPKAKVNKEEAENVKNNSTKKGNSPQLTSMLNQSPQLSFNDSYKDFIKNNVPDSQVKKRNIVKTKMGQFKPNLSPKKGVKRNSFGKAPDVEYEVKEQENDCNILILKI
ncbi:uncharacterized protein LOC126379450 [Pectinophora gossypiella]|uniref:uncharacterized protein LOC126379450 n=1 Tax=Pectinophora gossypiella TaxID=13191 RepID=UPI00214E5F1D|nr:uncharacterized protein LOC126379450 [Pectinophora gossypiella]